jgi:acyl CoA:acetate/3-ketoacid CoA transferase beta subunit
MSVANVDLAVVDVSERGFVVRDMVAAMTVVELHARTDAELRSA